MSTTNTTNSQEQTPTSASNNVLGAPSTAAPGKAMTETSNQPPTTDPTPTTPTIPTAPPHPAGRLWAAVLISAIVAVPLAWLLSYGATLPFFLGIFFFALFGLVVGAVVFRIASASKPYGKVAVLTATTLLVAFVFGFALVKESSDLPRDIAKKAVKKTADLGGRTATEYRADVANEVRKHLTERYPPGGTFGYVRWVLADGKLARGVLPSVNADLAAPQTRATWAIRVVLSIALLAFGIGSQTLGLYQQAGARKK